jgi:hypothetical protein
MWILMLYLLTLTPQECADRFHACVCRYEGGWKCEGYGPRDGGKGDNR